MRRTHPGRDAPMGVLMTPIEFMRAYEAATRAHDLRRTLDLIDPNAVYWFSDGGSHVGKAAIERALRGNFEAIEGEDYRIGDIAWWRNRLTAPSAPTASSGPASCAARGRRARAAARRCWPGGAGRGSSCTNT